MMSNEEKEASNTKKAQKQMLYISKKDSEFISAHSQKKENISEKEFSDRPTHAQVKVNTDRMEEIDCQKSPLWKVNQPFCYSEFKWKCQRQKTDGSQAFGSNISSTSVRKIGQVEDSLFNKAPLNGQICSNTEKNTSKLLNSCSDIFFILNFLVLSFKLKTLKLKRKKKKKLVLKKNLKIPKKINSKILLILILSRHFGVKTCFSSTFNTDYYVKGRVKTCLSSAWCNEFFQDTKVQLIGKYCVDADGCYRAPGTRFSIEENKCIAKNSVCIYYSPEDRTGSCRTSCPSPYTEYIGKGGDCHTKASCTEANKVTESQFCLTGDECRALENKIPNRVTAYDCIPYNTCTGILVYDKNPYSCETDCSSFYHGSFEGEKCYTATGCRTSGGSPVNPVEGQTQKLCLDETGCKSTPGYLWNPDDSVCTLEKDCKFGYFAVISTRLCQKDCPSIMYKTVDEKYCLLDNECELFSTETSYFKVQGEGNVLWCITEEQCKVTTDFIWDESSVCINISSCSRNFKKIIPNICTDTCDLFDINETNPARCLSTDQCREAERIPEEPAPAKCFTTEECVDSIGNNGYVDFDENSLKTCKSTCSRKYTIEGNRECRESCPYFLEKSSSPTYCLYSEDECRTEKSNFPLDYGDGGQKYCVTEQDCKDGHTEANSTWFDLVGVDGKSLCVTTTQCKKKFMVIGEGTCTDTCAHYLTSDETGCYTQALCTQTTDGGFSGYTVSGKINGKEYCLTEEQCKTRTETLINDIGGTKSCVLATDCVSVHSKIRDPESGTCISTCPNYHSDDGEYCYSNAKCAEIGNIILVDQNGEKWCLTQDECKSKEGYLYDFDNESCILTAACSLPRYHIVEESRCMNDCVHYLDITEQKCYTQNECNTNSKSLFYIPSTGQKRCFSADECRDKEGFVYDIDSQTCILETECEPSKFLQRKTDGVKECKSDCPLYLGFSDTSSLIKGDTPKYCVDSSLCETKDSGNMKMGDILKVIDTVNQNYCLDEKSCKHFDKFIYDSENKSCILKENCSSRFKVVEMRECMTKCTYYLNNDDSKCLTKNECDALTHYTVVDKENVNRCLSQTECENKEGTLFDVDNTLCIKNEDCASTRFQIIEQGKCIDKCNHFLDFTEKKCYTENECDLLTGDHYTVEDSNGKKYCLTQDECESKEGFTFDVDNKSCILTTSCTSPRFHIIGENRCKDKCDHYLDETEKNCYMEDKCISQENKIIFNPDDANGQKRCYSEEECKNSGGFILDTPQSLCVTKTQCDKEKRFTETSEKKCLLKCPQEKLFHQDSNCYSKCPKEGEFGQRVTFKCVSESECESMALSSGKIAPGLGNLETGFCINELNLDIDSKNETKNYQKEEETNFLIPKDNPRDITLKGIKTQGSNLVSIEIPFELPIPPQMKKQTIKLITVRRRRRRILQDGNQEVETPIEEYEIFTPKDEPDRTFVIFKNPFDEEFISKITYNTEKEFTTTGKDGSEITFKIGIQFTEILISAIPSKAEEPSGLYGIFTGIYDVYLRVISPFITMMNPSLAFQSLLAQNYQQMTLFSHLDFWKLNKSDWFYVKTFKDWIAEGGLLIVKDKEKIEETMKECKNGRERHCFYEKNLSLLTGGVGALIVLALFLIIGIIGYIAKSNFYFNFS